MVRLARSSICAALVLSLIAPPGRRARDPKVGLPVSDVTLPNAGQVTSTASPPRQIPLALNVLF